MEDLLCEIPDPCIAHHDRLNAVLSSKIREIIERQWGKRMADLQALYIGQFYERLVAADGQVSYRPSNRYVLQAKFHYGQGTRRVVFAITV